MSIITYMFILCLLDHKRNKFYTFYTTNLSVTFYIRRVVSYLKQLFYACLLLKIDFQRW